MQKIIPHLWFDTEAKAAAAFYVAAFGGGSRVTHSTVLSNTPSGDCDIVSFSLADPRGAACEFMAISAGPYFIRNPSISFLLNFDPSREKNARARLDALWEKFSQGGKALMPLDTYPFSEHYGWVEDRFGVSWQLMLTNPEGEERPFIIPFLMFTQDVCGKANEAIDFYASVFKNSRRGVTMRYPGEMAPEKEGTIMFADFQLEGQWFAALESAREHKFSFNEGISLLVNCDSQAEIDTYWSRLSAAPEAEQCGWLKDKYGVSWQISPAALREMLQSGDEPRIARLTEAFLKMKKFDIDALKEAYGKQAR
jgi:predicted 3-demethylubiquinone-9 3-methyltransferase (glyoxalase superfamily)